MNLGPGVKSQCRVCGNFALADQFKLHYQYKQMVCPNCYSGKTAAEQKKKEAAPQEQAKPAGWDKDDEYLEKASRMKKEETRALFTKIPGSELVKCACPHCKYVFKFDTVRSTPKTCPYCDVPVPKFRSNALY